MSQAPYLIQIIRTEIKRYNPEYGDERVCECGHAYYRHFDSYEQMEACGCKYCYCDEFVEIEDGQFTIADAAKQGFDDAIHGLPYFNPYSEHGKDGQWYEAYKQNYNFGSVGYRKNDDE